MCSCMFFIFELLEIACIPQEFGIRARVIVFGGVAVAEEVVAIVLVVANVMVVAVARNGNCNNGHHCLG